MINMIEEPIIYQPLKIYYDFDGKIITTKLLDEEYIDDYPYITITAEEHNNWAKNEFYAPKMVFDNKLVNIKPDIAYAKKQKLYEITENHLQANLKPVTNHSAFLLDNLGNKTEDIVNFCFDVKKTDVMVCDPLTILTTTIVLCDADFSYTKYYCKKIIDNQMTQDNIAICLDKQLCIDILVHLRTRTEKYIKLVRDYKTLVLQALTIDEINDINIIF